MTIAPPNWCVKASYCVVLVGLSLVLEAQTQTLPSIDPALLQKSLEMLKQMDATLKANPELPARAAVWEAGNGFVMNLTVTMKAAKSSQGGLFNAQTRSNITMRYTVSVPLNYGTPAVLPQSGPGWSLLALQGAGKPQAEARPVTMRLEWEQQDDVHIVAGCTGTEARTTDEHIVTKGTAAGTMPSAQMSTQGFAQAMVQLNGLMTTYDLMGGASFRNPADVVRTSRLVDHCAGDRVTNKTENTKPEIPGQNAVDIKGVPLPADPTGLKGSRTMPWKFNDAWNEPATIEWNIAPIGAR